MGSVFKLCICSKLVLLNSSLLYCDSFADVKICRLGTCCQAWVVLCQGSAKWACDANCTWPAPQGDGWPMGSEKRKQTGDWLFLGNQSGKIGPYLTRHFLNSLLPLKSSNWQKLSRNHPVLRRTSDMSLLHSGRQFL